MIELPEFVEFRYSEEEWGPIKDVVRNAGLNDKEIGRRAMELAATVYLPQDAMKRQLLNRAELEVLRDDAEDMRARIAGALAWYVNDKFNDKNTGPVALPHFGVDDDMLDATSAYFAKLTNNLNRQIENAVTRTRRDNARKPERDEFWTDLLLHWYDIGGEPTGAAAANFLIAASKPVGADADIKAVMKWLVRRKETISRMIKEGRSILGTRRRR